MKTASFRITKHQALITRFTAQDESRPVLSCVNFNFQKERLEAADGFRMMFVPIKDEDMHVDDGVGSVLVHRDVFSRAVKAMKSPEFVVLYLDTGDKQSLTLTDTKGVDAKIVDLVAGTFPDLDQIVEKPEFTRAANLSASLIKDVMAMAESKDMDAVEFALSGEPGSTSVTRFKGSIKGLHPFEAYVMPMVIAGIDQ